jgi:glyoxylase-like metal-dependent hydrolase (beta-lactamase superfamily II)
MEREQREAGISLCREITPDVYCMEIGKGINRSNVYFVRSGSSWVLIDAASAHCGQIIRKTAESLFGVNTPPASILLTHDHPDHAGSIRELVRMWDCPVYVHPDELPLAAFGDLSTIRRYANPLDRWVILPLLRVMPRRRVESMLSETSLKGVVRAFDPCAAVPGLPDWECIPTPGHTPGHVAFFRNRDRALITGDALLTVDLNSFKGFLLWSLRLNKQRVSGPPWYSTWNWPAAKESVAILARLEPRVLACGHGIPMAGDRIVLELRAFADHFSGPTPQKHTEVMTLVLESRPTTTCGQLAFGLALVSVWRETSGGRSKAGRAPGSVHVTAVGAQPNS